MRELNILRHIPTYRYRELIRSPLWKVKLAEQTILLIAAAAISTHLIIAGWYFSEILLLVGHQSFQRVAIIIVVLSTGDFIAKYIGFSMPVLYLRSFLHLNVPKSALRKSCYLIVSLSAGSLWPLMFIIGLVARGVLSKFQGSHILAGFFLLFISIGNSFHIASLRGFNRKTLLHLSIYGLIPAVFGLVGMSGMPAMLGMVPFMGILSAFVLSSALVFFSRAVRSLLFVDLIGGKTHDTRKAPT